MPDLSRPTTPVLLSEPGRTWYLGAAVAVLVAVTLCISPAWMVRALASGGPAGLPTSTLGVDSLPLAAGTNYSTYLYNYSHQDNLGYGGPFNASNVKNLHVLWKYATGAAVFAQPIVVNGIVYVGSSDGYEYALYASNGTLLWRTFLGSANQDLACLSAGKLGVTSTVTYENGTLYLGVTPYFDALNASTGAIAWQVPVGGTNAEGYYLWASPLLYNNSAYVGISSDCDHPLVAAGLERISLVTHAELAYFNSSVPNPNGSSIWGSPSLNVEKNVIFVSTGNPYRRLSSTYGESIIALNASTLALIGSFPVPKAQVTNDGDFGITPTLFNLSGGVGVVTGENKDGYLYELYQSNLTPVWEDRLTNTTGDHYSTSYANGTLYAITQPTLVGGVAYSSSIVAIDPANGTYLWQTGTKSLAGYGYAPPLVVNGLLVVPLGRILYVLSQATGQILYDQNMGGGILTPPASISRGEIFLGVSNDVVALDLKLALTATEHAVGRSAPMSVRFTSSASGGVGLYSYNWSFGDGTYSSVANPTHAFGAPGTYTVTVVATDLVGSVILHQFSVTIQSPVRRPPRSTRP